ncbi:MAG: MOSC domain-containing protein [Phaeodactylibacter sp.]|nr:MOSC domain-containing protein [Phaeodactylibacter sp.]
MHITTLLTYPIKSLAGISLPRARVEARGLAYDRRWMLVDRDGLFLSQREIPRLALLLPDFSVDSLIVRHRYEGLEPLAVPLHPEEKAEEMEVQVWEDKCRALRVSREADEWFSAVLGAECHLVYMPEESRRPLDPSYGRPGEITGFADSCPLLVIGESSLADLNSRLESPVPMNRFRPNIVFAGGRPYEEEGWESFRIGEAFFRGIRPCSRCQVTTINQETADVGQEPLRTLASYRRQGKKVVFGLHASWVAEKGKTPHVQVGDEIEAYPRHP